MTKSFKKWWPLSLFQDKGIIPTTRLIIIYLLAGIPISIIAYFSSGWKSFFILNSVFFLVSLFDLLILPKKKQIECHRQLEGRIERNQYFEIGIRIKNKSSYPINFRLIDKLPSSFTNPFPIKGKLLRLETKELNYPSKATVRGDYELDKVYFRYQSILGLWEKQTSFQIYNKVQVIPDMSKVREYLATAQQFLMREGDRVKKKQIGGGEFNQIRSYVIGDDPRKINWRQTAKLAELMTNVYEPEHGKYITILIDSGRTVGVELTKGNRFELAMEAALTVAAAALKQGDHVSVLLFANGIEKYVPHGKGMGHMQTIVESIYNVQSKPFDSNYAIAFDYLEKVQKRRSLILLFSDLEPFLIDDNLLFYIQRIRHRHMFLLIGIADPMVAKWIDSEPNNTREIMTKSIAQKQFLYRKQQILRWSRLGIEMLEVPEENLAIESVSRYINVINRGQL